MQPTYAGARASNWAYAAAFAAILTAMIWLPVLGGPASAGTTAAASSQSSAIHLPVTVAPTFAPVLM